MTLELPLIPVKLTLGREKQPQPPASTLMFDSKDFAIICLAIALLFATLSVVSMAAQR